MARLLVASQKRLGVGGSAGKAGRAVPEPRLSSNGSLPSLGSAPAMVESAGPFAVPAAAAVLRAAVVLGIGGETEKSSMVGTGRGKKRKEKRRARLLEPES